MINLAGKEDCDKYIIEELLKVGVMAVPLPKSNHPEVKSLYEGQFLGWKFRRQWYYWSVSCEDVLGHGLDMKYASPLHALAGQEVRLAGHCGCPSPDDGFWMEKFDKDGNHLIAQKDLDTCKGYSESDDSVLAKSYDDIYKKLIKEYRAVEDPLEYAKEKGQLIAKSYHIDSQEGLEIFCWALRKQAADKEVAAKEMEKLLHRESCALKLLAILDYFKIKGENPNGIFTCKKDESHGEMIVVNKEHLGHIYDVRVECPCEDCGHYEWGGGRKIEEVVKIYESRTGK